MTTDATPISDLPIHPGEFLSEEIEARGLSQRALAALMGCAPQAVNDLVRLRTGVTANSTIALERALGISARTWMNLQSAYELALAYKRARNPQPVA
jgi:addiction module HigA family antidote